MSNLFDRAFAVQQGMSDWTLRSLEPPKYHIDGKWVDSTDPRGLIWVQDEVSGCTYDTGEMKFCVLTVYDDTKTRPPFRPTRKHPTPPMSDPAKRFMLQVHDADDGYWERCYPEFPTADVAFLLNAQPLSLRDLKRVFSKRDLTDGQMEAAKAAVGGLTDDELQAAMDEFGAWHLPTLKIECGKVRAGLEKVNPDGGMAWAVVRKMTAVIAVRESC